MPPSILARGVLSGACLVGAALGAAQELRSVFVAADSAGQLRPAAPGALGARRYWTDYARNALRRSDAAGTQVESVLEDLHGPYGIAFDPAAQVLLWTSAGDARVQAFSPGGKQAEALESSFEEPYAVIARSDESQVVAYALDAEGVWWVRQDLRTGLLERELLLRLDSPEALHGLALARDGSALYLGNADGLMTRKLLLADGRVEWLSFVDEGPQPLPLAAAGTSNVRRPERLPDAPRAVAAGRGVRR